MTITANKIRTTIWSLIAVTLVCYTMFAIYLHTPYYDDPNAPRTYQMKLVDRFDASYMATGKSSGWRVWYKGMWKEQESGNVLTMTIDDYTMKRMHLGEVVPMTLTPERVGTLSNYNFFWWSILPFIWLVLLSVVSVFATLVFGFGWLLNYDKGR